MPIFLDDQFVTLEGNDLDHVLAAARRILQPRGRMVVEVVVDGKAILGDDLDNKRALPVAGRDVRLVSADPRELTMQTLQEVQGKLQEIKKTQDEAAQLIQRDHADEGLRRVGHAMELWQQPTQAVLQTLMLMGPQMASLRCEGQSISEAADGLLRQLKDLRRLVESGDMGAIADALAYEWSLTSERWDKMVRDMRDRL